MLNAFASLKGSKKTFLAKHYVQKLIPYPTFLSHGQKPEGKISQSGTVISPDF